MSGRVKRYGSSALVGLPGHAPAPRTEESTTARPEFAPTGPARPVPVTGPSRADPQCFALQPSSRLRGERRRSSNSNLTVGDAPCRWDVSFRSYAVVGPNRPRAG